MPNDEAGLFGIFLEAMYLGRAPPAVKTLVDIVNLYRMADKFDSKEIRQIAVTEGAEKLESCNIEQFSPAALLLWDHTAAQKDELRQEFLSLLMRRWEWHEGPSLHELNRKDPEIGNDILRAYGERMREWQSSGIS